MRRIYRYMQFYIYILCFLFIMTKFTSRLKTIILNMVLYHRTESIEHLLTCKPMWKNKAKKFSNKIWKKKTHKNFLIKVKHYQCHITSLFWDSITQKLMFQILKKIDHLPFNIAKPQLHFKNLCTYQINLHTFHSEELCRNQHD